MNKEAIFKLTPEEQAMEASTNWDSVRLVTQSEKLE